MNEEVLAVASLAKIVGSELHTIDKNTMEGSRSANKTDPRSFLLKNSSVAQQLQKKKNVAYHDGKAFYTGVDESYVQSMHPDPVPQSVPQTANTQSNSRPAAVEQRNILASSKENNNNINNDVVLKVLKSIDKSLKIIAKNTENKPSNKCD